MQFLLAIHGLSTHICPPRCSLLLAHKRAVLEMLSIGLILTLYFSPTQNCYRSHFLQLSHITFTSFASNHFFSHRTVIYPEEGSSTFLPNVKCQNKYHKAHHIFSTLCVNLKTYMTTVAAICKIPVSEAQNTVLEGPSFERAMKCLIRMLHGTEELHSESGY